VTGISYATSISSWKVGSRKLRVGLIGGTPFTSGVSRRSPRERIDEKQGYIGGVVLELQTYKRLSVEANGLYRPLRADQVSVGGPAGEVPREYRFEFTIVTWQLPVLAKYALRPDSRVHPFIEGGPSFRFSGDLNGSRPSKVGFTAGGGLQAKYGAIQVSPVLRYTRWEKDVLERANSGGFLTKPNQVELLVSMTF
jgi:opacity protein-like surface antigen